MKKDSIHLNESEIIRAVTDQNDLPDDLRRHLSLCSVCQKKKEAFEHKLNHLAYMTEKFAPLPQKKLRLPLPSPVRILKPYNPSWNRHPVFVTGMAVTLLLIVSSWIMINNQGATTAQIIREMEEDQRLITEIQYLEENILPDVYTNISGESYEYFDEEFLDFMVPVEENRNSV